MADNETPGNARPDPPPDAETTRRGGLPRWAKTILLLVVIAIAVFVLFTTVFPWVEERMQDPTMGAMIAPWLAHLRF